MPGYICSAAGAATMGKMQLCQCCLWLQHAPRVQGKGAGQSAQHYDLVGQILHCPECLWYTQMVIFPWHAHCPTGDSSAYKGNNYTLYLLDPASFSPQPMPAVEHKEGDLLIFHKSSWLTAMTTPPSPEAWESCMSWFLLKTRFLPQGNWCQTFAQQKGMLGMAGSRQILWSLANPLWLTLCCAISCQKGLQAEQAGQ